MVPATPVAFRRPSIIETLGLNSQPLPSKAGAFRTLFPPIWILVILGVSSSLFVPIWILSFICGVAVVSTPAREIGNETFEYPGTVSPV